MCDFFEWEKALEYVGSVSTECNRLLLEIYLIHIEFVCKCLSNLQIEGMDEFVDLESF